MKILTIRAHTILSLILSFFASSILGQSVNYPLTNEIGTAVLDRLEVLHGGNTFFHSSSKPMLRSDVASYALFLDSTLSGQLSKRKKADLQYFFDDNNDFLKHTELPKTIGEKNKQANTDTNYPPQYRTRQKPIFKYFYKTPANFWEHDSKYFQARLNPMLHFEFGRDNAAGENVFINQRGVDLRFVVDKRVYFQTQIIETQWNPVSYVRDWKQKYNALPGATFVKPYFSTVVNKEVGYDYLLAQGAIGFNVTPHIGLQFGHGQHFIGDGMRSLILSNFGANYLYLRMNTKVWKFHYQNIFAELLSDLTGAGGVLLPKKYLAVHHLNYNILPNLSVGASEMVIMSRSKQFELQYLNPIIFYRSVESSIGSADNILIGLNSKWHIKKRFSVYGQLLLDEFLLKELFLDNKGSWTNKYGVQFGAKYMNAFGIDHLDLQFEYNKVRPFTYSHYDSTNNYTHAFQPLAHPLGSNFKEFLFKVRYQPTAKWLVDARIMNAHLGENAGLGVLGNWGNEPLAPNINRVGNMPDGFFTTNGIKASIVSASLDVSYQFHHNMFLDVKAVFRKKTSDDIKRNQETAFFGGGLRVNLSALRSDF